MSDFGVIFCDNCSSVHVDSGYETPSTLKCIDCGNEDIFKVGKVTLGTNDVISTEEIINSARRDALN